MNFLANVLNAGACVIASNPSVSQFCVNLGADLIFPSTPPKWESNVPSGLEGSDRLPFQGLRDKFFQGQPKEKVGKRRIKELNQRIHKQFDALELGASRMLKVGVLFSSIGGLNFSDHSRFAEIHSENLASEKDFKRAIFNQIKSNLNIDADKWTQEDGIGSKLYKTGSWLYKMGTIAKCHVVYQITDLLLVKTGGLHAVRKQAETSIMKGVKKLRKDENGTYNASLRNEAIKALTVFLTTFNTAAGQGADNNDVKRLMEEFFTEKVSSKKFTHHVLNYILDKMSDKKMDSFSKKTLIFLLEASGIINVQELFSKLDTCLCEADGKPSHTLNMAVIEKLKMVKVLLQSKKNEGIPCKYGKDETDGLKNVFDELYKAVQNERLKSVDQSERQKAVEGQAHMDRLKKHILDSVVSDKADIIIDLIKDFLAPKTILELIETSLINTNGLLFAPVEEVPEADKIAAREQLRVLVKEVLDIVVQDAVEEAPLPYLRSGLSVTVVGRERMYSIMKKVDQEIIAFKTAYQSQESDKKEIRKAFILARLQEIGKIEQDTVMSKEQKQYVQQMYRDLEGVFKKDDLNVLTDFDSIHREIKKFLDDRTGLFKLTGDAWAVALNQTKQQVSEPLQDFVQGAMNLVANKVTVHYSVKSLLQEHLKM